MIAGPHARIDGAALRANLARVRKLAPGARVMAVVKANAYGHGLGIVARALPDVDGFAVARVSEAIALRRLGFRGRLLLLEGLADFDELQPAKGYDLDLVVHCQEQLDWLKAYTGDARFRVWLKIDTGMHRLGFGPADAPAVRALLHGLECVQKPLHLMTHFASADVSATGTQQQIERFTDTVADWDGERSLANSAGVLNFPDAHADWVRPGLMLYGVSPVADRDGPALGLRPAMQLHSLVIAVKPVRAGDTVGYGATWKAERDTQIAIVAIGYGDGYPWRLPSGTPVLIGGRRFPTAGRVSMDMIAVDIGDARDVRRGDQCVLWGEGLPVEEIAALAGTIPWELLCGISRRVRYEAERITALRKEDAATLTD